MTFKINDNDVTSVTQVTMSSETPRPSNDVDPDVTPTDSANGLSVVVVNNGSCVVGLRVGGVVKGVNVVIFCVVVEGLGVFLVSET